MALALVPPVEPMLARLSRDLPSGDDLWFEPKWDGFRAIVFYDGEVADIRSRNHKPFARYFPELADTFAELRTPAVVDGEIVLIRDEGFDFASLMNRIHPARSRVAYLAAQTPVTFVAFDLLALGDRDLRSRPFLERRRLLEEWCGLSGPRIALTPTTRDAGQASEWLEARAAGIDGVIVKHDSLRYEPGRRAMTKVKRLRTADCIVAGFRWFGGEPVVGSLLLGLYDDEGVLRHVGVSSSFTRTRRAELLADVVGLRVPLEGHPWEHGFEMSAAPMGRLRGSAGRWTPEMELDWEPLRPDLVAEVAYDQLDHDRFRHPARFCRWRPDRDPASCTFEQLFG